MHRAALNPSPRCLASRIVSGTVRTTGIFETEFSERCVAASASARWAEGGATSGVARFCYPHSVLPRWPDQLLCAQAVHRGEVQGPQAWKQLQAHPPNDGGEAVQHASRHWAAVGTSNRVVAGRIIRRGPHTDGPCARSPLSQAKLAGAQGGESRIQGIGCGPSRGAGDFGRRAP